jgi:predicted RNA-binding protein with PUA-like domain
MKTSSKNYWLIKSEPHTWSWGQQKQKKTTHWDGVRNYQASNNLKLMKEGDDCFFYHSGEERAIKGIVTIIKEYYPDHTDETGRFGMVDVKYLKDLENIYLSQIKSDPFFNSFPLVRQSRLSVMPVALNEWKKLLKLGGSK